MWKTRKQMSIRMKTNLIMIASVLFFIDCTHAMTANDFVKNEIFNGQIVIN